MPLTVGTIVAVNFVGDWQSQRYMLTTTWRILNTTSLQNTSEDQQSIAVHFTDTSLTTNFVQRYRQCLGDAYTIRRVDAQAVFPVRHVKATVNLVYSGQMIGTIISGNLAATITLRTMLAGRTQVANKHIGPLTQESIAAGAPAGGLNTALGNFGAKLTQNEVVPAGVNSITLVPVIFHKESGGHDVIVNHVVSDRIGTMRSRTLRVGE